MKNSKIDSKTVKNVKENKETSETLRQEILSFMEKWENDTNDCEKEFSDTSGIDIDNESFYLQTGEKELKSRPDHSDIARDWHFVNYVPVWKLRSFVQALPKLIEEINTKLEKSNEKNAIALEKMKAFKPKPEPVYSVCACGNGKFQTLKNVCIDEIVTIIDGNVIDSGLGTESTACTPELVYESFVCTKCGRTYENHNSNAIEGMDKKPLSEYY